MIRLIVFLLIAITFGAGDCFAGQWLFHRSSEIKGQVVEAGTLNPIEGALIIALWKLEDVVNEGPGGYDRVEVVESGKGGHFIIPSWSNFKPWQLLYKIEKNAPFILIFKPGFRVADSNRPAREGFPDDTSISKEGKRIIKERYGLNPAKLEKITNDQERLESLRTLGLYSDFPGRHFSRVQLRKLYKSYDEEVKNLADSVREKKQLEKSACELKNFYIQGGECEN